MGHSYSHVILTRRSVNASHYSVQLMAKGPSDLKFSDIDNN